MTIVVICNIVFATVVLAAIVGGLGWTVLTQDRDSRLYSWPRKHDRVAGRDSLAPALEAARA